jgi:6-phosphogluconolactonase
MKGSPFSIRHFPIAEAIDPTSKFAYVTHEDSEPYPHDGHIDGYAINKRGGAFRTLKGTRKETGDVPAGVAIDPLGKFVYVANTEPYNDVSAYTINPSTGVLTQVRDRPLQRATSLLGSRRARSSMTDAFRRHCSIRHTLTGLRSGKIVSQIIGRHGR